MVNDAGGAKPALLLLVASLSLLWLSLWTAVWSVSADLLSGRVAWPLAATTCILIFVLFQAGLLCAGIGRNRLGGALLAALFVLGAIVVFTLDGAIFHPGLVKGIGRDPSSLVAELVRRLAYLGVPGALIAILANVLVQWLWDRHHGQCPTR